jgi:hypothetical protein
MTRFFFAETNPFDISSPGWYAHPPRSWPVSAGAAGRVENNLAELGVDLLDDELGDGAGSIELTRIARRLEVFKELLVDVAEHVAVIGGIEVDAVDLVDDLPHQGAVLHVVVGILKSGADEAGYRYSCFDISLGQPNPYKYDALSAYSSAAF